MTDREAIDVLFNEWKCIDRNDGIHCDRKCESCDLVMDVGIIREAFNMAISALQAQELSKNSPKLDKENGDLQPTCNQLEKDICVPCKDSISRQAAIEALKEAFNPSITNFVKAKIAIDKLPSAPEPSIPVSWIEKHVDWLKNMDNGFATLTAMNISTMVKKWKKEQEEADGSDKPTSGD